MTTPFLKAEAEVIQFEQTFFRRNSRDENRLLDKHYWFAAGGMYRISHSLAPQQVMTDQPNRESDRGS